MPEADLLVIVKNYDLGEGSEQEYNFLIFN